MREQLISLGQVSSTDALVRNELLPDLLWFQSKSCESPPTGGGETGAPLSQDSCAAEPGWRGTKGRASCQLGVGLVVMWAWHFLSPFDGGCEVDIPPNFQQLSPKATPVSIVPSRHKCLFCKEASKLTLQPFLLPA